MATVGTFCKCEGRAGVAGLVRLLTFEFRAHRAAAVEDAFWRQKHVLATFWANVMRFVQVGRGFQ